MLAEAVGIAEIFVVLTYLFVVVYLGWLGYSQTKTAADYLIAGRMGHIPDAQTFPELLRPGRIYYRQSNGNLFRPVSVDLSAGICWQPIFQKNKQNRSNLLHDRRVYGNFLMARLRKDQGSRSYRFGEAFDRWQIQHPGGLSQLACGRSNYGSFANIDHCDCCCRLFTKPLEREHMDKCFS